MLHLCMFVYNDNILYTCTRLYSLSALEFQVLNIKRKTMYSFMYSRINSQLSWLVMDYATVLRIHIE